MGRVGVLDPVRFWIRRTVRKYTRPMSIDEAAEKKEMFSIIYGLSALTFFCYVNYMAFTTLDLNARLPELLQRELDPFGNDKKEIRVIKFDNFTKVKDIIISKEKFLEEEEGSKLN